MAVPLPFGPFNWHDSDFGRGPAVGNINGDATGPIYTAAIPYTGNETTVGAQLNFVLNMITLANTHNITVLFSPAGARSNWTDEVGDHMIYNPAKFRTMCRRWTVAGGASQAVADAVTAAFASRRFLLYVVDEPFIEQFGNSISREEANNMGLFCRSLWPDALTCIRAPVGSLTPAPATGWTGYDYGWAQHSNNSASRGKTYAQFYAEQKAGFLNFDMGTILGINFQGGGDGRYWNYTNNVSNPLGRVWGEGSATPGKIELQSDPPSTNRRWLTSPAELKVAADVAKLDLDSPCFLFWTHTYSNMIRASTWIPYETRADFVSAWDYMANTLATRASFNGYRTPKGQTPPPPPPPTSGVEVAYVEQTTRQTTVSQSYVDVPGVVIPSTDLVAGRSYLVSVMADLDISVAGDGGYMQLLHGSTAFAGSEMVWVRSTTGTRQYKYWTVWTAVASEGLKLQFKRETGGTATVGANLASIVALDLSTLPAGSVQFASHNTPTGLTTTFADGASKTFTPGTAAHDWLVLTLANYTGVSATHRTQSRLNRSGEASSTEPQDESEGEDGTIDKQILTTAVVKTLGAVSNTFKEQSAVSASTLPTRQYSQVLALDLSVFNAHAFVYTAAVLDYNGEGIAYGTPAQAATINLTGDSKVLYLTSHTLVPTVSGLSMYSRQRVDGADEPPNQTTLHTRVNMPLDGNDALTYMHQTVEDETSGNHTVSLAGSVSTAAAGRGGRSRLAVAIGLGSAVVGSGAVPVWNQQQNVIVTEGDTIDLVVSATDVETAPEDLVYSIVETDLPESATFDTVQHRLIYTPANDEAGTYSITFRVLDEDANTADMTFTITVLDLPTSAEFEELRNLRYDFNVQGTRVKIVISWNGPGNAEFKQGITGLIAHLVDLGRI